MTDYILKTNSLSKHYGKFAANDNISMGIKKGSIYGLVGRNGAGKTTFMKMICSLSSPTSGKVDNDKINEIIRIVGLEKAGKKPAGKFSLGMKQRLGIGLALVGDPEVLVLDEPINGLDPAGVAEIRDTLQKLNTERGITILISSHILGELSKLCTDYGFIDRGELIKEISNEQLMNDCTEYTKLKVDDTAKAKKVLESLGIDSADETESGVLRITQMQVGTDDITEAMVLNKVRVYEISKQGTDLEGYYLNMIGNGRES